MLDEQMSKEDLITELTILRRALGDHKRNEQSRLESDSYFRVMADHAPVLIWMSGLDKLCTYFNKRWLEFTGRTMEQEIGNGWADGVHPDDLKRCLEVYTKAFDARQDFQMQYRLRNAKNEYRWVLDQGTPRIAVDGSFTGYIGSCVDVTDHVLAMQELRLADERLRLVSKATSDVVWDWDLAGNVLYWGTNFEILFGYSLSEVEPGIESWHYRLHPEDHDRVIAGIQEVLAQGKNNWSDEYRFKCKDGSYLDVFDRGYVIFGPDGKPVRMVGAMNNITERKHADDKLAVTTSLLERTGAMANVGGWELDLQTMKPFWTLETYRIHEVDPSVQPSLDEAINFYAPEVRPVIKAAVQAGIDHGKGWDLELPFITAKGRSIWVRAQGSAIREEGMAVKLFGTFQDITARKLSEDSLRKNVEELKLLLAITVDRENTMIDLKKEVNALALELNRTAPYDLSFLIKE